MSEKLFTRIDGNTKIASFVNVYNDNNELLEDKISRLEERIKILEENYDKKADKVALPDIIKKEVVRVMDVDYNKDDESERRFVRTEDVIAIVKGALLNPDLILKPMGDLQVHK